MYQQALEKTMKSYRLQNPTNVSNLLKLRKMSKPGKETIYYHSHDLVLLAKGLSFNEGKLYFFKLQHKKDGYFIQKLSSLMCVLISYYCAPAVAKQKPLTQQNF